MVKSTDHSMVPRIQLAVPMPMVLSLAYQTSLALTKH